MYNNIEDLFNFDKPPVWFMRQAGRYMYEYNLIKSNFSNFFDMCRNVKAVKEITLLPVKKFDFDAAIIFSDILIILECLDVNVEFISGIGPVVDNKNIYKIFKDRNPIVNYDKLNPVYESINSVKQELKKMNKPLIGFSGAPWTIAAYLLEGKLSKDIITAKDIAYKDPQLINNIIGVLSDIIIEHISKQIESGADMVQVFDTHSNILDYSAIRSLSVEPVIKICKEIKNRYSGVPISYFSKNTNYDFKNLFDYIDIISFNSTVRMKDYINKFPERIVFQGNLDPVKLLSGGEGMKKTILEILHDMKSKNFIFNLGHGILPQTPRKNVEDCLSIIRNFNS